MLFFGSFVSFSQDFLKNLEAFLCFIFQFWAFVFHFWEFLEAFGSLFMFFVVVVDIEIKTGCVRHFL